MKWILITAGLFLCSQSLFSQPIDSLRQAWKDSELADTLRLQAGEELFMLVMRKSLDSARVQAEDMLAFSIKIADQKWQSASYRLIGNIYGIQGSYSRALENFHQSRQLAEELGDKPGMMLAYNNLGIVYYEQGDYPKALLQLQRGLKLAEEGEDLKAVARAHNNIGNVYYRQKNYSLAMEYYENNRKWREEMKDKPGLVKAYSNLGIVFADQGDYPKALENHQKSRDLAEELGDKGGLARVFQNMANVYSKQGRIDEALAYFQDGVALRKELGDKNGLASIYVNMGALYIRQKNAPAAKLWCEKSLNLAREIQALPIENEACSCLAKAFERLGDFRQALLYQKQHSNLSDSLFNVEKTRELTRLELSYAFDKEQLADSLAFVREKELMGARLMQEAARRRQLLLAGLGLLLAIALAGVFFWRSWRQRQRLKQRESDLNQERLLNERLLQVDKLKDQFLANTSHELRTPLQGIIGLSEGLLERSATPSDQEDLNMIISSGYRLNSLVNDILDFSRLKNTEVELQQKAISLQVLADIVLKVNLPLIKGKEVKLVNEVAGNLPAVKGDENRLQQILHNLVGNAIKFTETGYIKIGATEKDGMIEVFVEDTGIGIPENKREAIFQEFQQADGSIAREFAGTGLGLSISKKLVELHGGQMWMASEVGQGSTFYFTLPLSEEQAVAAPPPRRTLSIRQLDVASEPIAAPATSLPESTSGNDKMHILVVDDEPVNQQVFRNHLSAESYQLSRAMTGEEAIRMVESGQRFDLIVLDIMMPRISGYEVCRRIREKYLPNELPIIMVTAKNQVQDLVQGLGLGANDYLAKPFTKEEFLARIKTQIELHRINEVTGKFVPNEFLRSLGRDRITEVRLGDHTEREVTVFFSDIRDYTSLAESMTPRETFKFVNAFNGRLGPIIQQHNGFVNQYLGDGIMAIFPGSPADALKAAIKMQHTLAAYNNGRILKGRRAIKIGIGLHTGPLIMGIIGDLKRMDAATISDTVNTASRIESLTKDYGAAILLSEYSLNKIENKEAFRFRFLGKVQVKGKKAPVGIYEVLEGVIG